MDSMGANSSNRPRFPASERARPGIYAGGETRSESCTEGESRMTEPSPITYRMLHEDAAGMGLAPEFFVISGINPDAPVVCNCQWDEGHQATCDIVAAHTLRNKL